MLATPWVLPATPLHRLKDLHRQFLGSWAFSSADPALRLRSKTESKHHYYLRLCRLNNTSINTVMNHCLLVAVGLFLFHDPGRSQDLPPSVRHLIEQANPNARIEYCGAISMKALEYYLFAVTQEQVAGVVLVRNGRENRPTIVDADTSLFCHRNPNASSLPKPVTAAVGKLLERRNTKSQVQSAPGPIWHLQEVSSIGDGIDRIISPVSGFKLDSESTREIMAILRTANALSVEPANAPPGSIIVSPTQFLPSGPVSMGHAGIVGSEGSIYSADARYGGAWVRNFTLASWLKRFSVSNGSYAFLLRTRPRS